MNGRGFASPPILHHGPGGTTVLLHTYNWCGHPAFGTSRHEVRFRTREEAVEYVQRFGYEVI